MTKIVHAENSPCPRGLLFSIVLKYNCKNEMNNFNGRFSYRKELPIADVAFFTNLRATIKNNIDIK